MYYRLRLATFSNKKITVCNWLTGHPQEDLFFNETCFNCDCSCGEVAVAERFKWEWMYGRSAGTIKSGCWRDVATGERWPLMEVRLSWQATDQGVLDSVSEHLEYSYVTCTCSSMKTAAVYRQTINFSYY